MDESRHAGEALVRAERGERPVDAVTSEDGVSVGLWWLERDAPAIDEVDVPHGE